MTDQSTENKRSVISGHLCHIVFPQSPRAHRRLKEPEVGKDHDKSVFRKWQDLCSHEPTIFVVACPQESQEVKPVGVPAQGWEGLKNLKP